MLVRTRCAWRRTARCVVTSTGYWRNASRTIMLLRDSGSGEQLQEASMRMILMSAAAVIVGLFGDLGVSQAYDGPWCAVTNVGRGVLQHADVRNVPPGSDRRQSRILQSEPALARSPAGASAPAAQGLLTGPKPASGVGSFGSPVLQLSSDPAITQRVIGLDDWVISLVNLCARIVRGGFAPDARIGTMNRKG